MNKEDLIKLGLSDDIADNIVSQDKQKSDTITRLESEKQELKGKIEELTSSVEGEKERREKIEADYKQLLENNNQDNNDEPKNIFDEIIRA